MQINSFKNKKEGYSLLEMLIYLTLLTVIFIVVINTVLSYTGSYRNLAALRAAEHTGIDAMERMTRDIRKAVTANTSIAGQLTLTETTSGISTTTRFYVQNNVLKVDINGVYSGPLSVSNSTVSSLTFATATSTNSTIVKIDMTVNGISGPVTKTKLYHSTIILKGV